jgi:hypothetical protein
MGYKGSDLSADFKVFFRKEKKRISAILTELGCTNIELDYGFYYFSGFFTAPSGQAYYLSCSDVRHFGYDRLLIRTAKHYKDYTGGSNNYVGVEKQNIVNFRFQ